MPMYVSVIDGKSFHCVKTYYRKQLHELTALSHSGFYFSC